MSPTSIRGASAVLAIVALMVSACASASASAPPSSSVPPAASIPPSSLPSAGDVLSGKFTVGDAQLWMECRGTGSPTVVLEWGLGDSSSGWAGVVRDLAPSVRTCRYDRAGLGQSAGHKGATDLSAGDRANDLHALLAAAGVPGPYVLVGFSYGGMIARLFAHRFAAETAGLVLLDSSHEEQFVPGGWWLEGQPVWDDGAHVVDLARSRSELLGAADLGALPLIALTNGRMTGDIERRWSPLQDALAGMSSASLHMVATESDHNITADRPELVEEAIRAVVETVRTGSPLPACGPRFQALGAECLAGTMADLIAAWDAARAAVVPAPGKLPAGTYTFTEDGTVVQITLGGGRLDVTLRNPDGSIEGFSADYAADGDRVTFRWPFDWRIPRTSGVNTASWSADPDGTLHFVQMDDAPKESWIAAPWAPFAPSPGPG